MQNISKVVILVKFEMNREYIAKNLCEQKQVKGNCCKGSCKLNKDLKKEEKKEAPGNALLKDKSRAQLFFQTINLPDLTTTGTLLKNVTPYKEIALNAVSFSVFHPPC